MQLAGPWVLDQGLNLGPSQGSVLTVPSANRWTAFSEKRMLSGDLLRPPSAPQSLKARTRRAPALQLRAGAAAPGRAPNLPPSLRTRTPACSPGPGLPKTARSTSATRGPGGLRPRTWQPSHQGYQCRSGPRSEPHLLNVQSPRLTSSRGATPPPVQSHHPGLAAQGPRELDGGQSALRGRTEKAGASSSRRGGRPARAGLWALSPPGVRVSDQGCRGWLCPGPRNAHRGASGFSGAAGGPTSHRSDGLRGELPLEVVQVSRAAWVAPKLLLQTARALGCSPSQQANRGAGSVRALVRAGPSVLDLRAWEAGRGRAAQTGGAPPGQCQVSRGRPRRRPGLSGSCGAQTSLWGPGGCRRPLHPRKQNQAG